MGQKSDNATVRRPVAVPKPTRKTAVEAKLDPICNRYATVVKEKAIVDAQYDEITAKRKALVDEIEDLREEIKDIAIPASVSLGEKRFHLSKCMVEVKNGRPSVNVTDVDAVPDEFCKFVRTAKKTEIMEYYNEHEEMPTGCELVPAEPSIAISI